MMRICEYIILGCNYQGMYTFDEMMLHPTDIGEYKNEDDIHFEA